MVGVLSTREAIEMAEEASLDLIEISPNAVPPVAKISDYGKYKYEAQKKAHDARKHQKVIEVKEIKMRPNIDEHDYEVKMRAMKRFIDEGDKVKVDFHYDSKIKLPADVKAAILSPTLVATRFMQLDPAYTSGPEFESGATIPVERTAVPLEFDELKKQLDLISEDFGPNGANKDGAINRALSTINKNGVQNGVGQGQAFHDMVVELSKAAKTFSDGRGDLFGTVCGLGESAGVCAGITNNATTGEYGAYGMCNSTEQLGWALNAYYLAQSGSNKASACDFSGSATTKAAASPTGVCSSLIAEAGPQGTGTVTAKPSGTGNVGGSSGGSSASGSSSGSGNAAPRFGSTAVFGTEMAIAAYMSLAVVSGMCMIFL